MAARIAAVLMLCGKSAVNVWQGDDAERNDILLDEICRTNEETRLAVAALSTALFSAHGSRRLGFAHQTFAECLAASALSKLPIMQLRSILRRADGFGEHVVPQLAETAAWLAAQRPDFLELLIANEPEILMRSDVSRIQAQHKEKLVAALLDRAGREEAFDERDLTQFYGSLKHPGLGKQLWDYVSNRALSMIVRRMAVEIAGDCKLEELFTDFLELLRTEADTTIREYLARSLEKMTPPNRASELIPLAKGEVGPDPHDTIKGCALHVLIPDVWTVADALPLLTPANEFFFGAYRFALSQHIPKHIKPDDLKVLLPKLIEWGDCFDSLNSYHGIADKTLAEAACNLSDPEIAQTMVEVWRRKTREFLRFGCERDSDFKGLIERNEPLRLRLVELILNSPGTTTEDVHRLSDTGHGDGLLQAKDMRWLLEGIERAPKDCRTAWANGVSALIWRPEAVTPCWDLLLARIEAFPELKDQFAWLRSYNLDEPEARKARALWLRDRRRHARWQKMKPDAAALKDLIQQDVAEIRAGRTCWWVQLCQDMSLKPGETHYHLGVSRDILKLPGWLAAGEELRAFIITSAREFLIQHDDGYSELGMRTNFSDPGYAAIWLLRDHVRAEPDLRKAVADKWIGSIIGFFNNGEADHQEMVALAYEISPERCTQALLREVLDDDCRHGRVLALRAFRLCWNARLTEMLVNLIGSGRMKPGGVESSLAFLAEVDPQAAIEFVTRFLSGNPQPNPSSNETTKGVLCVALARLPAPTWAVAWPFVQGSQELAEHVLLKLANGVDYSPSAAMLPSTSEHQLAELYLLLDRVFAAEQDPPIQGGFVSPRQRIVHFRADVIQTLTARGTEEACRELLQLSEAMPNQRIGLRWRYWDAVRLWRRKEWHPLPPQTVCSLLDDPGARVIDDENDLLSVVLESLQRLQARLTKASPPEAALLWNYDGAGNRRTNFRPKDEEDLSDRIASWLESDIGPESHVVIGREVQPRRGQKTDLKVVALPPDTAGDTRSLTLIIEVKGCWNKDVRTAIQTQLAEDYLNKNGWTHGVYVVGWFLCDKWDSPGAGPKSCLRGVTYEDACKEVQDLAKPYDGRSTPAIVRAVCLDCRFPS